MSQFIATTALLEMRPVGTPADRSLPRLEAILARDFKDKLSTKLAEPIERRDGAGIDWYIDNENDDPIVRLKDLPDELVTYYKKRLDADVAMISAAIDQYETRTDAAARGTASALRSAVRYADESNIWVMGDAKSGQSSIVLTAWGYEPRTSPLAGNNVIHRREKVFPASAQVVIDHSPPPAAENAQALPLGSGAVVVQQPRNWLRVLSSVLWVVALLLPFIIGWYLLPACGVKIPFTQTYIFGWGDGEFCRQIQNPQLETGRSQGTALNLDLISVQDQVKTKIGQCVITPPVEAVAPASKDEALIEKEGIQVDPNETSVSLTWANENDLDLIIVCPDATPIKPGTDGSNICGFASKVDMNAGKLTSDPVEYMRVEGPLKSGTYKVQVRYFTNNDPSQRVNDFTVSLRQNGIRREITGKTTDALPVVGTDREYITVTEFTVP